VSGWAVAVERRSAVVAVDMVQAFHKGLFDACMVARRRPGTGSWVRCAPVGSGGFRLSAPPRQP